MTKSELQEKLEKVESGVIVPTVEDFDELNAFAESLREKALSMIMQLTPNHFTENITH